MKLRRPGALRRGAGRAGRPPRTRRARAPIGLRARITLGFGLGVLLLTGTLAIVIYVTTSSRLIATERSSLLQQGFANAVTVRGEIYDLVGPEQILYQLDHEALPGTPVPSSVSLLYYTPGAPRSSAGQLKWYSGSPSFTQSNLPSGFKNDVESGMSVTQTFVLDGAPRFAVGVQVPIVAGESGVGYVAVFDLSTTAGSLHALLAVLIAAVVVTTLAGAVLGRWASGRALRPLRNASRAALAIASGQLETRLEAADVSDLAVLASSFNRMADRLQQRIERDARFTSDVSHELRSPLTVLANSVSVLESRRDELPPRSQQALDLVAAEVRRFQRMVADLLEISRIDAGSAELDVSVVPVGELLQRITRATGRSGVPLSVPDDVSRLEVAVDKRRFERVVANLLDNADRYGGGATEIRVEARHGAVRLLVDDQGPGVPAADRERIFERFSRGSSAGSRGAGGGTGLGLALVGEHVKLHGGRVWVEDRPGGGARFVVELPLADSADAPARSGSAGTPDELEGDGEPVSSAAARS